MWQLMWEKLDKVNTAVAVVALIGSTYWPLAVLAGLVGLGYNGYLAWNEVK